MSVYSGPEMPTDNLVLALDASNSKSYPGTGTTWYDLSGKGNHASKSGEATLATWNSAGYFEHRPTGSYGAVDINSNATLSGGCHWIVQHSASLNPNGGFWSVAGWLKVIGDQSPNGVGWFHKRAADERSIHLEPISGNFRANAGNGWEQISYNIDNTGVWAHFCWTFNQTSGVYGTDVGAIRLYINGIQRAEDTTFTPILDAGYPLWLGRRNGHLTHFLNGDIANYFFYTKTLSDADVKKSFNATRSRFGI